jgi:hypothetical protein
MFWKRRQFVKGTLGILAGGAIASVKTEGQTVGAGAVQRSSNLLTRRLNRPRQPSWTARSRTASSSRCA